MTKAIAQEIEVLIRARYPLIYLVSWEEKRLEDIMREIADKQGKRIYFWSVTDGLQGVGNQPGWQSGYLSNQMTRDPLAVLDYIAQSPEKAIYVLKDFHPYFSRPEIVRRLRDLSSFLRTSFKTLFFTSPFLKLPAELEKEVTVVDFSLPTLEELDELLTGIIKSVQSKQENSQLEFNIDAQTREKMLKAAQGLTLSEAESAFARAIVLDNGLKQESVDKILEAKRQIIRKSGLLEYYPVEETIQDVGGLENLKDWLRKRSLSFTEKARKFGLPEPKGVLLIGVQGCGKSLCAKAVSSLWQMPLLRLDIGKIFSGIVGSSEENMRKAIRITESVAPVILWLDEIEKGFSGTQGALDGGTTSRVFGSFITWMQEKKAPVFIIATANNISSLPPELLRKGRFDEIFFVDLPSCKEREEIFKIHLQKKQREPEAYDLQKLSERADGFSGAEIEQAVIAALYDAFEQDRDVNTEDILANVAQSVPLSVTMAEKIEELRDWAKTRARLASRCEKQEL